jgi:hypothetical protein
VIVDRITETLLAPEVAFRCLDGDVTQQKLNLFQFRRQPDGTVVHRYDVDRAVRLLADRSFSH